MFFMIFWFPVSILLPAGRQRPLHPWSADLFFPLRGVEQNHFDVKLSKRLLVDIARLDRWGSRRWWDIEGEHLIWLYVCNYGDYKPLRFHFNICSDTLLVSHYMLQVLKHRDLAWDKVRPSREGFLLDDKHLGWTEKALCDSHGSLGVPCACGSAVSQPLIYNNCFF